MGAGSSLNLHKAEAPVLNFTTMCRKQWQVPEWNKSVDPLHKRMVYGRNLMETLRKRFPQVNL